MQTCSNCKSYFPLEEDNKKGDCVRRVIDRRQAYYLSKIVKSETISCSYFQEKK
jgi:benzylsuccinate synthase